MRLITTTEQVCDWCARGSDQPLLEITLVTPRGAFREEICEACAKAYEDIAE